MNLFADPLTHHRRNRHHTCVLYTHMDTWTVCMKSNTKYQGVSSCKRASINCDVCSFVRTQPCFEKIFTCSLSSSSFNVFPTTFLSILDIQPCPFETITPQTACFGLTACGVSEKHDYSVGGDGEMCVNFSWNCEASSHTHSRC